MGVRYVVWTRRPRCSFGGDHRYRDLLPDAAGRDADHDRQ
jgi:hypothetical protein